MKLTLKYHGRLTELFGKKEETVTVTSNTAETLKRELEKLDIRFRENVYQLAQNNKIIKGNEILTTFDVDVFPPFSGG